MRRVFEVIPRRFFWVFDLLALTAAFLLAGQVAPRLQPLIGPGGRFRFPWLEILSPPTLNALGQFRPVSETIWMLVVMASTTFLTMAGLGGYRPLLQQSRTKIVLTSLFAVSTGAGFIALVLFTLKSPHWSRLFIFSFAVLGWVALGTYRLTLNGYRRKRLASGFYARHVVLIGSTAAVAWMARYFTENISPTQYLITGYLSLEPDPEPGAGHDASTSAHLERLPPRIGSASELGDVLVHQPIHEVIAVVGVGSEDVLQKIVETCDYFRVTLRVVPGALLFGSMRDLGLLYHSDPLHLPEVVLTPPELESDALFIKRMIDIVVSAVLLVLLSPLFLIIAILIKLTTPRLPVLYRWQVVGYLGRPFTGYKFTTMVADADARRQDLLSRNEMNGPVFKIKDDPRVTPLGRVLRRYSLNELPQLWSVLVGDMSLVGPRPAFPHELERYALWHKRKLCVRPGITCLWQVRGRNRINNFDDWVRMDLEYIDSWSLWLDVKILAWTGWAVVKGTGS